MAPQERTEVVQNLERSRQEFFDAVAGLTAEQASLRPHPDRWSVLECVEHVGVVEDRFRSLLETAEKVETPRIDKEKEARLMVRIPDRSTRVQAPEYAVPAGRFASLEQALEKFNASRAQTIQFAEQRCDELYYLGTAHPRLGPMNGVEFLILMAGHSRRHAEQIREARAALQQA